MIRFHVPQSQANNDDSWRAIACRVGVNQELMVTFPLADVQALRKAAADARQIPGNVPKTWSLSRRDPMRLLAVFDELRIKPGYVLRAYVRSTDHEAYGEVWAMPVDAPILTPEEYLEQRGKRVRRKTPAGFLPNVMEAIEGDGAPWSYLSASIFCREAGEFGAAWHSLGWSLHSLRDGPLKAHAKSTQEYRERRTELALTPLDHWTWKEPPPTAWGPSYAETPDGATITLHTYSGYGQEGIYRSVDRYGRGSYVPETEVTKIAEGASGYCF